MRVIVCLDDKGGMTFNNRRQSRDRVLIADVVKMADGSKIFISQYSRISNILTTTLIRGNIKESYKPNRLKIKITEIKLNSFY